MDIPIVLDHSSFKPLYYQINEALRVMIEFSDLKPGARLPSENDLIAQYCVSRNTARRALNALIMDGIAYTQKGKGTFVAPPRTRTGLLNLTSFSEEIESRGQKPGSCLLNFSHVVPSIKISRVLAMQIDEEAFKIDRLRLADGKPMALNTSYLPCRLCPYLEDQDLVTGSLYKYLEDVLHLPIDFGDRLIKGGVANEYEADLLHIPIGYPVVITEGPSYMADGSPLEYTKIVYRGDRYEFSYQVVRRHLAKEDTSESH